MTTYVLVHGAWHTGAEFEPVAAAIRAEGHTVHCPTVAGNRPGDSKRVGLEEAIASIVDYLAGNGLEDVVLLGHSYGGMVITGVADRVPERIRRLVYWNAFVPNDGEALNDLVPPHYVALFDAVSQASPDNSVVLPFPIWREAFINDADLATAQAAYDVLNPHPYATFTDKIRLSKNPAEMELPKSYLYCTEDCALPQSLGWHPRLSEKLGLFRLIAIPGSHELCFTDPGALAGGIMKAGRD
ncbi:alpha/beta fold hydrolase [Pararhodobacter aggregans]|uniref:Alpha/beta hydrolase n=1 Tax=Pararhodobacter aggregans TaxID=404875 RepID=A0A2T7UML2_9RHOB|nr:alpha/beta hydrolase family protein [Pararhodobacter aggregans]PTW99128.1 alpha/beta hydrolase family protein [Pararhodobacter aggregans]PVE45851.1 alpha/beta hydrolase [Pararhodobacter aggregans]